jgi:hypothetical protein
MRFAERRSESVDVASAMHFTLAYHIQQGEVGRDAFILTHIMTIFADRAYDFIRTIVQFPNACTAKGMAALKNLWESNPGSVELAADLTLQGS